MQHHITPANAAKVQRVIEAYHAATRPYAPDEKRPVLYLPRDFDTNNAELITDRTGFVGLTDPRGQILTLCSPDYPLGLARLFTIPELDLCGTVPDLCYKLAMRPDTLWGGSVPMHDGASHFAWFADMVHGRHVSATSKAAVIELMNNLYNLYREHSNDYCISEVRTLAETARTAARNLATATTIGNLREAGYFPTVFPEAPPQSELRARYNEVDAALDARDLAQTDVWKIAVDGVLLSISENTVDYKYFVRQATVGAAKYLEFCINYSEKHGLNATTGDKK